MDPEILEEEIGDGVAEAGTAAAAAAAAALVCLSCGVAVAGAYCQSCGQKNDDLRRSTYVLAKDFIKDTFAFDSRMWRTLGLLATRPGRVPADYAHGVRARYTPPIRLFLVVSFLFFLELALTSTLFVAIEIKPVSQKVSEAIAVASDDFISIGGEDITDCQLTASTRFFVRASDVQIDKELWRRCSEQIKAAVRKEVESGAGADPATAAEAAAAIGFFERTSTGVTAAIENPSAFNASVNTWLPRIMFLMTPVLALILALFIRGRNALMFDHLVLSFYSHAVGFAIVGLAIVATQLGAAWGFPAALAGLLLYFLLAVKRAYGRRWIKTVWTTAMASLLYITILSSAVVAIVVQTLVGG